MTEHNICSEKEISDFLYFGFIPEFDNKYFDIYKKLQKKDHGDKNFQDESLRYYLKKGIRELDNIFDHALSSIYSNARHVILLSGGLDSRAILSGLLERVDSKQIQTITFGTPGTWDFEIGKMVAKSAGVKHKSVDLTNPDWKWEENALIETAKRMEQPVQLFDSHVIQKIPEIFGKEYFYWVGFFAQTSTQPLIGTYTGSQSWDEAKVLFVKKKKFVKSMRITPTDYDPVASLPMASFCDPATLSYDDQLRFMRQNLLTRQILFRKDYNYVTPFYNFDWISYFSKLPKEFRYHYLIYKEILKTAYPRLFSLPAKNNSGYKLNTPSFLTFPKRGLLKIKSIINANYPKLYWGVHPNIKYIDFDQGLRENDNLRELIDENLHKLIERDLITWIDLENIWSLHQRRKANYADVLLILIALELHMKVEEKGQL